MVLKFTMRWRQSWLGMFHCCGLFHRENWQKKDRKEWDEKTGQAKNIYEADT